MGSTAPLCRQEKRVRTRSVIQLTDGIPRDSGSDFTISSTRSVKAVSTLASHELVADVGLRAGCHRLKSVTAIDQHLAFDQFHAGSGCRTTE